ncbi:MAG: ribonuclease HII [Alphaproteobacteria bacterium TMED199]|nr:MAG: ribonuclease HII [Alphaproteobacteria bacterium TMED199]
MISFDIERDLYKKNIIMIGVDEAGRGSWAGPLVSTACWFDFTKYKSLHSEINDSKKLKSSKRREIILSLDNFVKYSSSIASVVEIDKYGLSYANSIAMKRSIFSLTHQLKKHSQIYRNKDFCIYVDGKFKPDFKNLDNFLQRNKLHLDKYSIKALVKGDSLCKTIALASIISKEIRDTIMRQWSKKHPSYLFDSNFGYGTKNHINAILKNGVLDLHRKSFKPIATTYGKIN